jgi:hypothetical protein
MLWALACRGNVVYLAPGALDGPDAHETMRQLDALASGRNPSQPSPSKSLLPGSGGVVRPATGMRYRDVQEAAQGLLDDVGDIDEGASLGMPGRSCGANGGSSGRPQMTTTPGLVLPELGRHQRAPGAADWRDAETHPQSVPDPPSVQPTLPAIHFTLSDGAGSANHLQLVLGLPAVSSASEVEVDVGETTVRVAVPGVYAPLQVRFRRRAGQTLRHAHA